MSDMKPSRPRRTMGVMRLLALLAIPLLLALHAPLLAAVVPGALLTVASLQARDAQQREALPSTALVDADDLAELMRVSAATPVSGHSHRVVRS